MSGNHFVCRLRRNAATLRFSLERTFLSLVFFSPCEAVMVRMDWAADKFVWVRHSKEKSVQGRISVYPYWLILRIEGVVICCGMRSSQPSIVLSYMVGIGSGDGSDGSGDWGL